MTERWAEPQVDVTEDAPEGERALESSAEDRRIRRRRFEQFARLGFGLGATALLVDSGVDPNEARRLIGLGARTRRRPRSSSGRELERLIPPALPADAEVRGHDRDA